MAAPENLLRHETSPYLLQHADNPVHWRPWGPAALEEARTEKKPILLSIGYAACHWCHVMAHESFEDPETAALMNERFVNIKVDREERPDIDHLYMSALHALGEQGGWPLTMFIAPDGAPFWGGTYFPPEPRWGRPSFRQVLQGVSEAYRADDDMVKNNAAALRQALTRMSAANPGELPTPVHLDAVAAALLRQTDPEHGGLQGAMKFPNPPIFRFLWQNAFRTGAPEGQEALHLMLDRMSAGGIYDHLGGGYSRYSTDTFWLVPHFEKMLYDNAQLLELLALVHAHRPDPLYAERAAETVGWMVRDMTAAGANGRAAFAASEDADSEGEEGRFYVWTEAEVDALLGPASAAFKRAYDVTPGGNWEGHTILRRVTPRGSAEDEIALARSRQVLFEARARRVRPGRDDKVLADWNGLAIAALARAAGVFARPDWLARAEEAQDFVLAEMSGPDGRVQHAWRLGRVTAAGLLEDQAAMARASLALFEATRRAGTAGPGGAAGGSGGGGVLRRDGRVLHHRRGCDRRAVDAPAHGGGQRHAGGHRRAGGGVRAALAPDRRGGVAGAGPGAAAGVRRQTGTVRGDADAAGGRGSAGGSGDRGDRRRSGASARAGACGGGARRGGSGGRGAAGAEPRFAAGRPSGVRQVGRERGRRSLCLPPQCVRDADGGWRGPGRRIVGARIVSEPSHRRSGCSRR